MHLMDLLGGEISFRDVLTCEVCAKQFDIHADLTPESNRNHGNPMRMREIETNGQLCIGIGDCGLSVWTVHEPDCSGCPRNVSGQQFTKDPSRRDEVISIAIKNESGRARLFVCDKGGFQAPQDFVIDRQERAPDVDFAALQYG
ncbi:MAG: hypothetical protein WA603_05875, partial [Candidatus Acidiferrales bacterium]